MSGTQTRPLTSLREFLKGLNSLCLNMEMFGVGGTEKEMSKRGIHWSLYVHDEATGRDRGVTELEMTTARASRRDAIPEQGIRVKQLCSKIKP